MPQKSKKGRPKVDKVRLKTFQKNFRARCHQLGHTQKSIAFAMDMTIAGVSVWWCGKGLPTYANLEKLLSVLDISREELFRSSGSRNLKEYLEK